MGFGESWVGGEVGRVRGMVSGRSVRRVGVSMVGGKLFIRTRGSKVANNCLVRVAGAGRKSAALGLEQAVGISQSWDCSECVQMLVDWARYFLTDLMSLNICTDWHLTLLK